jgi:hypothetical protein
LRNLLFFVIFLSTCCRNEQRDITTIVWENNKAKAIRFPLKWANDLPEGSASDHIKIRLMADANLTTILGDYTFDNTIVFEPLIPFSRGSTYEIIVKDKKVGEFSIPMPDSNDAPQILFSYPQHDTVPENLLKIYIQFSQPMSEGQSARYIKLVKNGKDTLRDVFLDLQPELWNENRTVITLWLDPGRIKRDLQPNLRLGTPLQQKGNYQFIVSRGWKNEQGLALQKDFTWSFTAGNRDSISPDPDKWELALPNAMSKGTLTIKLGEALDHFLLVESLLIKNEAGVELKGRFEIADRDRTCHFIPAEPWIAGNYTLLIDAKLEDLAGNNINRPFDRDITRTRQPLTKEWYSKKFRIMQ